jgi:hypothetical protein
MKYTVIAQIEVDGVTHPVGGPPVELTDAQAASVPGCVMECPAAPATAAKPAAAAAALATTAKAA